MEANIYLMVAKMSQIASWVLMHSLPWMQHKRWIPIGSMGCVHTHWRIFAINGWVNPSHVQNVVEKFGENNQKDGKINWIVNQVPTLGPKHDKIQARWVFNILLESMLERCRCFKMESLSWTICCLMSYSNGGKHT
jgi:hypothetical protein